MYKNSLKNKCEILKENVEDLKFNNVNLVEGLLLIINECKEDLDEIKKIMDK
jgi:hypothetical protein